MEKCLDYDVQEIPTGSGTLKTVVYEDHAEITGYEGTDIILVIPEFVNGLPIVSIATNSFYKCGFEQVVFPETLKRIGRRAFNYCRKLQSVTLPAGIEYIGDNAFLECTGIEFYAVSGNTETIKIIDGVLFSPDGKTLRMYPNAKGTEYVIPEGTESIGYGAFARTDIEYVTFPSTLKVIENGAFYDTHDLHELVFPDNLEEIGTAAFSTTYNPDFLYVFTHVEQDPSELLIGPKVRKIGEKAFYGLVYISSYVVDPGNSYYGSVDGFLTNEAEDTILAAPYKMDGFVKVPEGIVSLNQLAFKGFSTETEYYLPDTLVMIPENVFPYSKPASSDIMVAKTLVIHCSEGSAPEAYAIKYGLPYDNDMAGHYEYEWEDEDAAYTFTMYSDHAALISFKTELKELTLPDEVNGVPVTIIGDGNNAVYDGGKLRTLRLPDSVEIIMNNSLSSISYYELEEIKLPKNLVRVHPSTLAGCRYLHTMILPEGCENYRIIDGVLFSGDGKELILFPPSYDAERYGLACVHVGSEEPGDDDWDVYTYIVPEGTEVIGTDAFCMMNKRLLGYQMNVVLADSVREISDYAFAQSDGTILHVELNEGLEVINKRGFSYMTMEELRFPETLKEIGPYAFEYTNGCSELIFPDSLEKIGDGAFLESTKLDKEKTEGLIKCSVIHFGKSLKDFDPSVFYYMYSAAFDVDEENPYYSSKNGFLLNKDGTVLISCPTAAEGSVYVPDGVTTFENNCFYNCHDVTDIYLPESVTTIATYAFDIQYSSKTEVIIHCKEDSYAGRAVRLMGLNALWE